MSRGYDSAVERKEFLLHLA